MIKRKIKAGTTVHVHGYPVTLTHDTEAECENWDPIEAIRIKRAGRSVGKDFASIPEREKQRLEEVKAAVTAEEGEEELTGGKAVIDLETRWKAYTAAGMRAGRREISEVARRRMMDAAPRYSTPNELLKPYTPTDAMLTVEGMKVRRQPMPIGRVGDDKPTVTTGPFSHLERTIRRERLDNIAVMLALIVLGASIASLVAVLWSLLSASS